MYLVAHVSLEYLFYIVVNYRSLIILYYGNVVLCTTTFIVIAKDRYPEL